MKKRANGKDIKAASLILDTVWERTCSKYEAFVEIDEEYGLEDSVTFDLEDVLAAFLRAKSYQGEDGSLKIKAEPKVFSPIQIEEIIQSIVDYNGRHKEVILITDKERSDLTSLVSFTFPH